MLGSLLRNVGFLFQLSSSYENDADFGCWKEDMRSRVCPTQGSHSGCNNREPTIQEIVKRTNNMLLLVDKNFITY